VIWNLQRDGFKHVQERVLSGHRRAVNRICWHPTDGTLLLSGSQDGTIKLWVRCFPYCIITSTLGGFSCH
jgi:WD repeat-containing protein 24